MSESLKTTLPFEPAPQYLAANESPSGVINSAKVAGTRSYFRSRSFTSHIGCNPLCSAASVLLTFKEQLKRLEHHDNLEQLHQDLVHEIQAFESQAQERSYSADTILIARYILCAALDETIIYSRLNNSSLWQHHKLISTFQNEQSADERFFLILERLYQAPANHIDLLELIYILLSLGYEGKYRHEPKGYLQLHALIDSLYQTIRMIRHDPPKLFASFPSSRDTKTPQLLFWPSLLKISFTTLVLTTLIYGSCALVFNKIMSPVQSQLNTLLKGNGLQIEDAGLRE